MSFEVKIPLPALSTAFLKDLFFNGPTKIISYGAGASEIQKLLLDLHLIDVIDDWHFITAEGVAACLDNEVGAEKHRSGSKATDSDARGYVYIFHDDVTVYGSEKACSRVAAVVDTLKNAAEVFRSYGRLHLEKKTEEGNAKAETNFRWADEIDRALGFELVLSNAVTDGATD